MCSSEKNREVLIEFKDLTYNEKCRYLRVDKEILHNLNGKITKGKMVAILGPSGAGKTTLLNILSGYVNKNIQGTIMINGVVEDMKEFRKKSCYITQENHVQTLLTVEENMKFAADLKLGPNVSQKYKNIKIKEKLSTLGLSKIVGSYTCKLSGGERKRLSIALELLSNPSVMFLDEPTTGLDSSSCYQCMNYLKELSKMGKTIICTVHTPTDSIFQLFDEIYVLSSGNCVYQGERTNLLSCLEKADIHCPTYYNPADFIIELASGDYGEEKLRKLEEMFLFPVKEENSLNNYERRKTDCVKTTKAEHNFWHQFKTLVRRETCKSKRNLTLTYLRLITSVTNSLVLSLIFWKVGSDGGKVWFNYNCILGFALHLMMPSLMLTILTFPSEILMLKHEYFNRWYSLKMYYAAITITDLPISIIYCIVSNLIIYYLTDQPMELFRFLMFSFLGFMVIVVAQSKGLLVGALFNVVNGTFIGSALSFPMLVFGGFGVTFLDIPSYLSWMTHISYLKYGVEGMTNAVNGYNRTKLPCLQDYCHYRYSSKFLEDMGIPKQTFWTDVTALCIIFIILRVLAFVALRTKINRTRL